MLKTLKDSQTETGHYTYQSVNIAKYKIDGENKLLYIAPREVTRKDRTYNSKTYEYTHGMGQIIAKASSVTENEHLNMYKRYLLEKIIK